MQVARATVLLAALALGAAACRKEEAPAPAAAAPQPAAPEPGDAPPPAATPPDASEVPAPVDPEAARRPNPAPGLAELRVGLSREELLARAGGCLARALLHPARGEGARSVEVFQPTAGACQERLGANQYWVVGGVLESVRPGLLQQEPPRRTRPDL